jgi:hypothetical protein
MVQASPASVAWMASKENSPPVGFPTPNESVMYLGHDDKMVVIYVPRTSSTWRVPEDKVLVQIKRS